MHYTERETTSLIPLDVGIKEFDQRYSDRAQYGKVRFWDERYLQDLEPFEWYYPYSTFKDIINRFVAKEAKILLAGHGEFFLICI